MPPYAVPSRWDPVVRMAANAVGGPAGRHLAIGTRGLAGVAAAIVSMGAVLLGVGVFQKGFCLANGWANPDQFWRACYSDIPVVTVTSSLATRELPWTGAAPTDQAPLSGLVMWVIARVTPQAGTDVVAQRWVFALWALAAVLLIASCVVAAVALRPTRPWQAAHLAASPVLAVLALVSVDLVAVALTVWAWWAWSRHRPLLAGALLGIAFLARPYPLVFLLALVLIGWRAGHRQAAVRAVVSAVAAALLVFLPLILVMPGAGAAARSWWTSPPGYGAPSLVPQLLGLALPTSAATVIAVSGWVIAGLVGGWLAFGSRNHPSALQVAAVMFLVVALTAKSVPVQTGVWVLPFLALSAVAWRDHLIWAAAEIIHFEAVWLYIGFGSDAGKGLPPVSYAFAVLLRLAAWGWVCWRVWDVPLFDDDPVPEDRQAAHQPDLPQPRPART